jgi:phenylpropionate dioxygenase-like ring-hydroxylating dioxygenase large terminal subunit
MTTVDSDETIVDSDDVRVIETGALPERFARGWHCLGLVEQFRDGVPHSVQAFGTKLVVFANSHGDIKVLDAYCRHMGGDLSKGTVKGDSVACPFHDWRWGGNGKCTAIPYARRVPPLARTRSWTTLERNGQVFVWHDPQRSTPPADVTIPAIEGFGDPQWSDWAWNAGLIEGTNCRELVDNVVDMAHFYYVHFNVPPLVQERVRRSCCIAVHDLHPPIRHGRSGVRRLRRGQRHPFGCFLLWPVVHDRQPHRRHAGRTDRNRPDQLPLPDHR